MAARSLSGLSVALVCGLLWIPCAANSQEMLSANTPQATRQPHPQPPPQPQPTDTAYPPERGGGPLQLSVGGLADGISTIADGRRMFSVCWRGGEAPYGVHVTRGAGEHVLDAAGVEAFDLSKSRDYVDLTPGGYGVAVLDSNGGNATGRFTVVPSAQIPGGAQSPASRGDALAQANALLAQGAQYDLEAYLRLIALGDNDEETQRLLERVCPRPTEEAAESAIPLIPDTEVVLSSDYEFSSSQSGGQAQPAQVFSYLTKEGAIESEGIYSFETTSANTYCPTDCPNIFQNHYRSSTTYQEIIPLFAYGVTDDLSAGFEFPAVVYATAFQPSQPSPTNSGSGFSDPSLFASYRVFRQSDAPATVFLRSSFSPDVFRGGANVFDFGETVVRQQGWFAVSQSFDATSFSGRAFATDGMSYSYSPYWAYHGSLAVAAILSDRWSTSLGLSYSTAALQTETSSAAGFSSISSNPDFSVSPSVGFEVIPGRLSIWLSYAHYFDSSYRVTGTSSSLTKTDGADIFGLVLRSDVSLDKVRSEIF
jgi:hypothetical protein